MPWHQFQPFVELLKLVVAALVGLLVTAIHQPAMRERSRAMEQAQTLLCVSGAMMMIIIGNSLARAFGIAGAASIIRFRTPVDDPKDVTILFLLMGLGMSAGLGAFAVVGLGAAFLCTTLLLLGPSSTKKSRAMSVAIVASGSQFPSTHVEGVFARNHVAFEPREIAQSDNAVVKCRLARCAKSAWRPHRTALKRKRRRQIGCLGAGQAGARMSISSRPVLAPADSIGTSVAQRRAAVVDVIRNARRDISLSLFRCDDEIFGELERATARGVSVNVLVTPRAKGGARSAGSSGTRSADRRDHSGAPSAG